MSNIHIRLEERYERRVVEKLTRKAFWNKNTLDKLGVGCVEHYMVNLLRKKDGILELNFVAELDGQVVGHVIYSKSKIVTDENTSIEVLNFGPLSVLPEYQNQGIGKALMNHSIKKAKELGYGAIVFFGIPEYYPRFGFREAKEFGISTKNGNNYPAFMAMELKDGFFDNITGKYYESSIYDESLIVGDAKKFDDIMAEELDYIQSRNDKNMNIILETERLFLREYSSSDADDLIKIASKNYVTDWLPDWLGCDKWALPWIEECVFDGYKADDPLKHFITYAIVEKESNKIVGQITCGDFQEKEANIGYFIDEAQKNKGFTTEALNAFCQYVFNKYDYKYLVATIQPSNISSISVAEKVGFKFIETIHIKDNGQTKVLPFNFYKLFRK